MLNLKGEGVACVEEAIREITGLEGGDTQCVESNGICMVDRRLEGTRSRVMCDDSC